MNSVGVTGMRGLEDEEGVSMNSKRMIGEGSQEYCCIHCFHDTRRRTMILFYMEQMVFVGSIPSFMLRVFQVVGVLK